MTNKYQQALNFLYNTIKDNLISFDDTEKEAVETLQELVDKATPTKPSYWGDGYDNQKKLIYDMYDYRGVVNHMKLIMKNMIIVLNVAKE